MKKILMTLCLVFALKGWSQSIVDSVGMINFTLQDSIGEKLADLALENPAIKIYEKQIDANKAEWNTNKASWLNHLTASFNLNEANLKSGGGSKDSIGTNVFYPRYNFSLNVPLGMFFTRGQQTKKARAQYEESIARKDLEINNIREVVKVRYQNYQMNRYLQAIQETIVQDEMAVFQQVESKFKSNSITLDAFTLASKRMNEALLRRVTVMRDLNVAKYELETLIGMKLETALALIKR